MTIEMHQAPAPEVPLFPIITAESRIVSSEPYIVAIEQKPLSQEELERLVHYTDLLNRINSIKR